MEPEPQDSPLAPLTSIIQNNPVQVIILLMTLIVIIIIAIGVMLQVQAGANELANLPTEPASTPVQPPSKTPRPTSTRTPTATPTSTNTPLPTPTFTPTPIIIDWRELGELDTLEVSTVTVFEETNPRWWLVPDAKILVRVTGLARFGIDISRAQFDQVTDQEGTAVRLVLPHATVTGVELIDAQVYDEQWFPNAALGINATQKALDEIESWANEQDNLLEISEKLAAAELENFLRQLGFEEVEIVFE